MARRSMWFAALGALLFLPLPAMAHGGRSARLVPPEGGLFPEARGEVVLNNVFLLVKIEDVAAGDYPVLLDDGTGALQAIGTISALGDDDDEGEDDGSDDDGSDDDGDDGSGADDGSDDGDDGDEGEGILKLHGDGLPFGATSPLELGGRAIQVQDSAGAVILEGTTPAEIEHEPEPRSGRCELSRPDPATDPDAEGVIKVEAGEGRIVIKVHLQNLEPGQLYEISLTSPDGSTTETIGTITANEGGNGQFKLDSEKGDAIPFGAGSLADLEGSGVTVKDAAGATILQGSICAAQDRPGHDDGDDDDDDDPGHDDDDDCESRLIPPEGAADTDAAGKVELELGETEKAIEIKVANLEAETLYGVSLTDPAEGGATEAVGEITTNALGRGKLEIEADEAGETLPFGKATVEELAGFLVAVTLTTTAEDGSTVVTVVLGGSVPSADCAAAGGEDESGDDHGDDGVEPGDDNGDDGTEPGDDNGDDGVEPGDDNGNDGTEPGDDNGDDGVEPGDDNGGSGTEPGDDNGGTSGQGGGASIVLPESPLFGIVGEFDAPFLRGDANHDARVDLSDAVSSLNYLFVGSTAPYCLDAADANDDGRVDIADPISLLAYLFVGQSAPVEPGVLIPGSDPTADFLYCEETPAP